MDTQDLELEYYEHRLRLRRGLRRAAFEAYMRARRDEKQAQRDYDMQLSKPVFDKENDQ